MFVYKELGDRGAGKTTSALKLVQNDEFCSLLTDETIHIYKRSHTIAPFPIAPHLVTKITDNNLLEKTKIDVFDLFPRIASTSEDIAYLIFLEKIDNYKSIKLTQLTEAETFQFLLSHHLDIGCNKDDAILTLLSISKHYPGRLLTYHSYTELIAYLEHFRENFL